jgi:non-heme chloroperoxidase
LSPESRRVDLAGVSISYAEQGRSDGAPVLLHPGFGDSWRSFEPVLSHLPESIRGFAISPRGHGDSSHPRSGYRWSDYAGDVAAFMDVVHVGAAVVVGHSSSCFVAQRFALDHPQRALGLVLIGCPLTLKGHPGLLRLWESSVSKLEDPIDPGFVREFQESATGAVSSEFLESMVAETMKVPAGVWRATIEGFLEEDLTGELGNIRAPTLLIWGDRDPIAPRADQDAIAAAVPDSRLAVHGGSGHSPHWENPAEIASDIVGFVGKLAQ